MESEGSVANGAETTGNRSKRHQRALTHDYALVRRGTGAHSRSKVTNDGRIPSFQQLGGVNV